MSKFEVCLLRQRTADSGQVETLDGAAGKEAEDTARLQRSAEHVP